MVKQTTFVMFKARTEDDMLMDSPQHTTWRELCTYTCDRDHWIARVRGLRQIRVTVEMGTHIEEATTGPFTISRWPVLQICAHDTSQGCPRRYCVWRPHSTPSPCWNSTAQSMHAHFAWQNVVHTIEYQHGGGVLWEGPHTQSLISLWAVWHTSSMRQAGNYIWPKIIFG